MPPKRKSLRETLTPEERKRAIEQIEGWQKSADFKQLKEMATQKAREAEAKRRASEEYVTSAIHVRKSVLALLRHVAVSRANKRGGRPSVSGIITELVERHWDELEAERD
jgi:predicted nucleic acid-binding Zn ribbon protein